MASAQRRSVDFLDSAALDEETALGKGFLSRTNTGIAEEDALDEYCECGTALLPGAEFCQHCGQPLETNSNPDRSFGFQHSRSRNRRMVHSSDSSQEEEFQFKSAATERRSNIDELQEKIDTLRDENMQANHRMLALEEELEDAQQECRTLREQLEAMETSDKQLMLQLSEVEKGAAGKKITALGIFGQIASFKQKFFLIWRVNLLLDVKDEQLNNSGQVCEELEEELRVVYAEKSKLEEKMEDLIAAFQEELSAQKEVCASLTTMLEDRDLELTSLRQASDNLVQDLEAERLQRSALEMEDPESPNERTFDPSVVGFNSLQLDLRPQDAQVEQLNLQVGALADERNNLLEGNEKLKHMLHEEQESCAVARAAVEHHEGHSAQSSNQLTVVLDKLTARNQFCKDELSVQEELCKGARQQEDACRDELAALQSELDDKEVLHRQIQAEYAQHKGSSKEALHELCCELQEQEEVCRRIESTAMQHEQVSRQELAAVQADLTQHEDLCKQLQGAAGQCEEASGQELETLRDELIEHEELCKRVRGAELHHEQGSEEELAAAQVELTEQQELCSRLQGALKHHEEASGEEVVAVRIELRESEELCRRARGTVTHHEHTSTQELQALQAELKEQTDRCEELQATAARHEQAFSATDSLRLEELTTVREKLVAQEEICRQAQASAQSPVADAAILEELRVVHDGFLELEAQCEHAQETIIPAISDQLETSPAIAEHMGEEVALMKEQASAEKALADMAEMREMTAIQQLAVWRQGCEQAWRTIQQMPQAGEVMASHLLPEVQSMRMEATELHRMCQEFRQKSSDLQAELDATEEGAAKMQSEIRELGAQRDMLHQKAVERSICMPNGKATTDEDNLRHELAEQGAKFLQFRQSSGKEPEAMRKCMTQEILELRATQDVASSLQARLAGNEVHCGRLQLEAEEERQSGGTAAELRDELTAARSQLSVRELQLYHIRSFMQSLRNGASSGSGSPLKGKALFDAMERDLPSDTVAAMPLRQYSTESLSGTVLAAAPSWRSGQEASAHRLTSNARNSWMQNHYGTQCPPPAA